MTFTVTPAQFAAAEAQANAEGIHIAGDSGEATDDKIAISWKYDGTTLEADVLSVPWPLSKSFVESKFTAMIQQIVKQNP